MHTTANRESIVDKKFHITFRDLVWIVTLILTAAFFYFDSSTKGKQSSELMEYKLNELQEDQNEMQGKIEMIYQIIIEDKKP